MLDLKQLGLEMIQKAELFAGDEMMETSNTAKRIAVVEVEQLGVVVCLELGSAIGRGFDGALFERRRVPQAAEARTQVSKLDHKSMDLTWLRT